MARAGGTACITCQDVDRSEIDLLLATGTAYSEVSRRYGINRRAVARHAQRHLSPALVEASRTKVAVTLLGRVEALVDSAEEILTTAKGSGRPQLALSAIREVRESLKLLGQASGELKPDGGTTVQVLNVQQSPEWLSIRTAILGALDRFPEAKAAVVAALTSTDAPLRLEGPLEGGRGHAPAIVVQPYRADDDEAGDDGDD